MYAVRSVRRSITHYQLFLVFFIVIAVAGAGTGALVGSTQYFGISTTPGTIPCLNNTTQPPSAPVVTPSPALLSLEAVEGIAVIAAFVFLLLSFLAWRRGMNDLERSSSELGTAHYASVQDARRDYSRTIWTFVGYILVAIGVGVAIATIVAQEVLATILSPTCTTGVSVPGIARELLGVVVAAAALSAVFLFLLHFFSTRSLSSAIGGAASPEVQHALAEGRRLALLGPPLTILSLLQLVSPLLAALQAIGLLLLLWGFHRLAGAYDRWLSSPVPPGPGLPPAPVVG